MAEMSDRVTKREVLEAALELARLQERVRQYGIRNRPSSAAEAVLNDAEARVAHDLMRRAENHYSGLFHRWDGQDDQTPAFQEP